MTSDYVWLCNSHIASQPHRQVMSATFPSNRVQGLKILRLDLNPGMTMEPKLYIAMQHKLI